MTSRDELANAIWDYGGGGLHQPSHAQIMAAIDAYVAAQVRAALTSAADEFPLPLGQVANGAYVRDWLRARAAVPAETTAEACPQHRYPEGAPDDETIAWRCAKCGEWQRD